MTSITKKITKFLLEALDGKADLQDELIEEFGEFCKDALRKHFKPHKREWRMRLSGLGKPLVIQQCQKLGLEEDPENKDFLTMKFLIGDLLEAVSVTVMKGAGINIQSFQEEVKLNLDGETISGTLDVIIDDEVWDAKTASEYSFQCKFQGRSYVGGAIPKPYTGFKGMLTNDPFGYVGQGFGYAEAKGLPFAGWIVINKQTGEIIEVRADNKYKDVYINTLTYNVKVLKDTNSLDDIDRTIPWVNETLRGKETGRKILHPEYKFFPYKNALGWMENLEYVNGKYYLKE